MKNINARWIIAAIITSILISCAMNADDTKPKPEDAKRKDAESAFPSPGPALDYHPLSQMPSKTNAPNIKPDESIKFSSPGVPANPLTFEDGVRWGATAARRNPDVWDLKALTAISFNLFVQEQEAAKQMQANQLQASQKTNQPTNQPTKPSP